MNSQKFKRTALERIENGKDLCAKWQTQARDDYAFIAGDQWEPDDKALLDMQERPYVTFNYSEKMIDAVGGAEVSNRQEVVYRGRQMDAAGLAEVYTAAARWCRDECNAEDEETDAFRDALICGMGWIETRMDYTEEKDGMPVQSRIDPLEMIWDSAAIKPSLADRRWDAHGEWMDNDAIKARWPRAIVTGGDDGNEPDQPFHIQTGNRYRTDNDKENIDRTDQSLVWNYECYELEPYYRVDTGDNNIAEISRDDFRSMQDQIEKHDLTYVKAMRKVYYRAFFANDTMLEFGPSPCQEGFTRNCITGKRDRNKNLWYGLTRVMKDPQRWANKWLSQIMHIINSNAKGGLLAEQNAFVNPQEAKETWAAADSITWLKEGGIGKIKEKQMAAYPAGLAQMMEFALQSLPQVTGINLEALGLANRDQANVLEQSRKQAAYGLLAPVFDSLKRYRKMQGKILLYFIRHFIADGRLVRVVGVGKEQYVQLTKLPDNVTFSIIVDAAPTAPDTKRETWEALMQIVPVMMKEGIPIPPDLLTYAPLPQDLILKWQQFMQQNQSSVNPEMVRQMQQQVQDLSQKNTEMQLQLKDKSQEMELKVWQAQQEVALEQQKLAAELEIKRMEAGVRIQQSQMQAQQQMQITQDQSDARIENAAKTTDAQAKAIAERPKASPKSKGKSE